MDYPNILMLANHLQFEVTPRIKREMHRRLDVMGRQTVKEIQSRVGKYDPNWSNSNDTHEPNPLRPDTIARKGHEDPWLDSGYFYGTLNYQVDKSTMSVEITTDAEYASFVELGTSRMPPRPIMGPSMEAVVEKQEASLARSIVMAGSGMNVESMAMGEFQS